jgi:hypothetical protein
MFEWPTATVIDDSGIDTDLKPMVEKARSVYEKDEVTYING